METISSIYGEMRSLGYVSAGYYDEPLAKHTTFRIGGPADVMVVPADARGLAGIISLCRETDTPCYLIGGGSNLLAPDEGVRGVVINTCGALAEVSERGEMLVSGCGAKLSTLAKEAQRRALSGLEFSYGIPGCVGGGVYMNAGAYGGEMKDVCAEVVALSVETGETVTLAGEELGFGYRRSAFSEGGLVVLEAAFRLYSADPEEIGAVMEKNMEARRAKQPLELPSAGSAFKRPEGHFAGALIDECGLRGLTVGGAQVSTKHAGFVVNIGGATAADVRALLEEVKERVLQRTGVVLEPEIRLMQAL